MKELGFEGYKRHLKRMGEGLKEGMKESGKEKERGMILEVKVEDLIWVKGQKELEWLALVEKIGKLRVERRGLREKWRVDYLLEQVREWELGWG